MVMRAAGVIKLCKECRHLTSQHGEIRSSIYYDYSELLPERIITLECNHWLDEEIDSIERELNDRS